jgi:hypothetical protein
MAKYFLHEHWLGSPVLPKAQHPSDRGTDADGREAAEQYDGEAFLAYIDQCLVPTLKRRDIVVIDNVSFHKVSGVEEAIQAGGASLRYLPQYSPDLQ